MSGELDARDVGRAWRRRVDAGALEHIHPVHTCSSDLDEHLAGSWLGDGALFRPQHLGAARRCDRHRRHDRGYHAAFQQRALRPSGKVRSACGSIWQRGSCIGHRPAR
jgi:hypothetical protein